MLMEADCQVSVVHTTYEVEEVNAALQVYSWGWEHEMKQLEVVYDNCIAWHQFFLLILVYALPIKVLTKLSYDNLRHMLWESEVTDDENLQSSCRGFRTNGYRGLTFGKQKPLFYQETRTWFDSARKVER